MSVRTQEIFEHAESPSKEGLNVVLEVSLLYHVNPEAAARLYQQVGPQFDQVVLVPSFRSAIRGVTVQHESKDLYTSGRELIANQIAEDLSKTMVERGLILEQVLLRRIQLPQMVEAAINDKLAAEQQSQRMQFVLAKETQEAERKRIEAKGIQDFQNIVSQGLSDPLLRWKGIEATKVAGRISQRQSNYRWRAGWVTSDFKHGHPGAVTEGKWSVVSGHKLLAGILAAARRQACRSCDTCLTCAGVFWVF